MDSKTDLILNADDRLLISTYDNVLNEYREPTEVFVTKRGFRTAIADADSDGDFDVLIAEADRVSWLMNTDGRFLESDSIANLPGTGQVSLLLAQDVDLDGDVDVLLGDSNTLRWLVNDSGTYQTVTVSDQLPGSKLRDGRLVDVDHDGDLDAALSVEEPAALVWLENTGDSFSATPNVIMSDPTLDTMTFDVADLNGDLLVDFIVGTSNELVWYENLGQGQTAANQQLIDLERPSITGILILDFDEDGDLDILSSANGEIDDHRGFALHENQGVGANWRGINLEQSSDGVARMSSTINAVDRTFAALVGGDIAVIQLDPLAPSLQEVETFNDRDQDFDLFVTIDMDGDGHANLVASDTIQGEIVWFDSSAAGYKSQTVSRDNPGLRSITAGDVDADGTPDIIIATSPAGQGNLGRIEWLQKGEATDVFERRFINEASFDDTDLHLFDADKDGDLDLFVTQTNKGETFVIWYEYLRETNQFQAVGQVYSVSALDAQLVEIDYDQDDDLDLLVAYSQTGKVVTEFVLLENLDGRERSSRRMYRPQVLEESRRFNWTIRMEMAFTT